MEGGIGREGERERGGGVGWGIGGGLTVLTQGKCGFSCVTGANGDVKKKERKMHRNRIRISNVSPAVLAEL